MQTPNIRLPGLVLGYGMFLTALGSSAHGQCEMGRLLDSGGATEDQLGNSVSISGEYAMVGAWMDDDPNSGSGTASIFHYDGSDWVQQAKLSTTNGWYSSWFGFSVSISGDWAVGGAPYHNAGGTQSGSAYVFQKPAGGPWVNMTETAQIIPGELSSDDHYGYSVSIDGDALLVGARKSNVGGAVYVWEFDGADWIEQAKLTASDAASNDYFGASVSISGDTALVGAFSNNDAGTSSGSAYVFVKPPGGWVDAYETAKLTASDAAGGDEFGNGVSISGDTVLVGAWGNDDVGGNSGSAYIYEKPPGGWVNTTQETAKLSAGDAASGDFFGWSVSISGEYAVAGAYQDDDAEGSSGSVYVFKKPGGGWVDMNETAKLTVGDPSWGDELGQSVSISGDYAVAGAMWWDGPPSNVGAAYVFAVAGEDCNGTNSPDVCDILDGTSEDENGNGIPDECEGPIPTVSQWGMIMMTLLLLTTGTIICARRRSIIA